MLEKGKKVGEYVLLEKLGAGGFGEVWKAEKRTELSVSYFALKFFRPKDDDVIDVEIVKKEIQTWQSLSGLPNVISVIEANKFEDYVFIVSEFAEGGSLDKWLKASGGKAGSIEEAVKIAGQILRGLEGMHGEGFVHRDLKPANVLLKRNIFYLADFGISRQMKTHSKTNSTAGTYEFMPPEAFEKNPSVSVHTDIWAVGAILQVLLTGQLPFPQDEIPSLITAILMSEPEPLPENFPRSLREIVKKSLQKKREDRFQSASEMREALRNVLTPPKPVESQTFSQAATIEDSDKTAKYQIAQTHDWREIEAEKERQQKFEEGERLNQTERLKQEPKSRLEIEEAKRREEIRLHNIDAEKLRQDEELERQKTGAKVEKILDKTIRSKRLINIFAYVTGGLFLSLLIAVFLAFIFDSISPRSSNSNNLSVSNKPSNSASSQSSRSVANANSPVSQEIESPPLLRQVSQPSSTIHFENSRENLKGDLIKYYLGFSLYYPKDWTKATTNTNFLDISRRSSDEFPIEQMIITRYESLGTMTLDKANFPKFAEKSKQYLKKSFGESIKVISEGETTIQNGRWKVYEVKFQSSGENKEGKKMTLWGRRLWLPVQRAGVQNGFVITMLATSFSDTIKSVDDVGIQGDLANILETFEPSQNY